MKIEIRNLKKMFGTKTVVDIEKADIHSLDDLHKALQPDTEVGLGDWVDLAGLIAPRSEVTRLMDDIEKGGMSYLQIQDRFRQMHENYYIYEWTWAADKLQQIWGCSVDEVSLDALLQSINNWQDAVVKLDRMVYEDAKKEFNLNSQTGFGVDGDRSQQVADFESVRGSFESNSFVKTVLEHIERKTTLGNKIRTNLETLRAL